MLNVTSLCHADRRRRVEVRAFLPKNAGSASSLPMLSERAPPTNVQGISTQQGVRDVVVSDTVPPFLLRGFLNRAIFYPVIPYSAANLCNHFKGTQRVTFGSLGP
jgi:hypothetical protein